MFYKTTKTKNSKKYIYAYRNSISSIKLLTTPKAIDYIWKLYFIDT